MLFPIVNLLGHAPPDRLASPDRQSTVGPRALPVLTRIALQCYSSLADRVSRVACRVIFAFNARLAIECYANNRIPSRTSDPSIVRLHMYLALVNRNKAQCISNCIGVFFPTAIPFSSSQAITCRRYRYVVRPRQDKVSIFRCLLFSGSQGFRHSKLQGKSFIVNAD